MTGRPGADRRAIAKAIDDRRPDGSKGVMPGATLRHFLNAIETGDLAEASMTYHRLGPEAQDIARPHLARLRGEERETRRWSGQAAHYRTNGHNGDTHAALIARGTRSSRR